MPKLSTASVHGETIQGEAKHIDRAVASKSSPQGSKGWQTCLDFVMTFVRGWPWLIKVKCVDQISRPTMIFGLSHATEGKEYGIMLIPTAAEWAWI